MAVSSKKITGEESGRQHDSHFPLVQSLLETCRAMLPLVRRHCDGDPDAEAILQAAERVIVRGDRETSNARKGSQLQRHGFFGRIGNHYDFEIVLASVREKQWIIRCEGQDRQGRKIIVRVKKGDEPFAAHVGGSIFFRGRVIAHRTLFGEPVTHIEATSGVLNV